MGAFVNWFAAAVVSPVLLYVAILDCGIPYVSRQQNRKQPAAMEGDATDEAAAIQKTISKKTDVDISGSKGEPAINGSKDGGAGVRFFRNKDVLKVLPLAPKSLPPILRGVTWLDQTGAYGMSSLTFTFDDLSTSAGGEDVTWDPEARVLSQRTSGLSGTWHNSAAAYRVLSLCRTLGCGYDVKYNEDYTFAQIVPFGHLPVIGKISVPSVLASFTATTLFPKPGECPPKPGATKLAKSKCARARRDSRWFKPTPPFFGFGIYYVFQIGDEDNHPIHPYFDEFLKYADTTSVPDPMDFTESFHGAILPPSGRRNDVQMISTELPFKAL